MTWTCRSTPAYDQQEILLFVISQPWPGSSGREAPPSPADLDGETVSGIGYVELVPRILVMG